MIWDGICQDCGAYLIWNEVLGKWECPREHKK